MMHSARPHRTTAVYALALCALAGCGSKTGLDAPDAGLDAADIVDVVPDTAPDAICLEPPDDAMVPPLVVDLDTRAQIAVADVLFVIDHTGSMQGEIDNIRSTLQTVIVPGLEHVIPDLRLGVITYGDFPVAPYGEPGLDSVFNLEQPMTAQFAALEGAIGAIRVGHGGDDPEGMVESLYQVATGEGYSPYIAAAPGCPSVGVGYACFRPSAEPVIIVVTDAPSHNGPDGSQPYAGSDFAPSPPPHSYAAMIAALNARLHPHVIGINSADGPPWGRDDLVRIGRDTATLDPQGQPLVFDIGSDGSGLGDQVVEAIQAFIAEVRFDVSARAIDLDGSGLVLGVRPVRADPMSQVDRIDATTFYNVLPSTHLFFALDIDRNHLVPQRTFEQRFTVRIQFLADGRPTLGYRDVVLVIPAFGAPPCADAGAP